MKEIVTSLPESKFVHRSNVSGSPIIGFVLNGQKGWFQKLSSWGHEYRALSVNNGVSLGNGWSNSFTNNNGCFECLNDFFKWVDYGSIHPILYLFDSEKELFKWLSEE